MVYMLLGEGFEEIEAIAPLDLLRRVDVDVTTVSLTDDLLVRGGHDIIVQADISLGDVNFDTLEMLVLPGGGSGVNSIANSSDAMDLIFRVWKEKKKLAAICAAPSLLAKSGVLEGLKLVCHPGVSKIVIDAGGILQTECKTFTDENLITGKSAGTSMDFGFELIAALYNRETADNLRSEIFY